MPRLPLLLLITTFLCTARSAPADVFDLAAGGQLVGELLNEKELPRQTYQVRTAGGVVVELTRTQVAAHRKQRPVLEEYAEIKPQHADTVEGQWALAEWCRANNLSEQRAVHLQRIVELDPQHEGARRGLGFVKFDGEWSTQESIMEARGYVKYKGRWRLPQDVALLEQKYKFDQAGKEWFKRIRLWRDWMQSTSPTKYREATDKMRSIDDPQAISAIRMSMNEKLVSAELRMLLCESLAKINTPTAQEMLLQRSLLDENAEIRRTAIEMLQKAKSPETVTAYIRQLKSKDNVIVNRAALGLHAMAHPAAVGPLIDALVTQHKFQVTYGNPGGGMGATFGGQKGGGNSISGMSAGGGTKVIEQDIANQQVLEALIALTSQNYNYDKATWKRWYAAQQTPVSRDVRRDDPPPQP